MRHMVLIALLLSYFLQADEVFWPQTLRAFDSSYCRHFGDEYVFTFIDIDMSTMTYKREQEQCHSQPSTFEYGVLERANGGLKKMLTKTCSKVCSNVGPTYDGDFRLDEEERVIETTADGKERNRYTVTRRSDW